MPRYVLELQGGRLRLPAEGHRLDLYEVRMPKRDQLCVVAGCAHVLALDEREPVDRPLLLLTECGERGNVPLPEVCEQRPIHCLQVLAVARIHAHVELRHRRQGADGLRELGVGHEERADLAPVQVSDKLVDLGIHDGLADERQRAVPDVHGLLEALGLHARDAAALADHAPVRIDALGDDCLGLVHAPLPLGAHGVLVVPPAEGALVGACEGGRCLHALVRRNAVERVLVAPPSPPQLVLGPPAELHGRVRADYLVALLRELRAVLRGEHLLGVDLAGATLSQLLHVGTAGASTRCGGLLALLLRAHRRAARV
mmetsp:Transcript_26879/g.72923  ORF Transcript_26879/g.72923 Transcript_26879/m.72923 type:complete len:314 (+) Transcript_26879:478-1419(+)